MPSKNDLSALKGVTKKPVILPIDSTSPAIVNHREIEPTKRQVAGRPPKTKAKKRSYKVTLSLTQNEGAKLAKKSGLAGEATYLYAKLKEMNII